MAPFATRSESKVSQALIQSVAPQSGVNSSQGWDRMRQCAEQADRLAVQQGWGRELAGEDVRATGWSNHYSVKFEKCFVRVDFINRGAGKVKTLPFFVYLLYDGFEGRGLASCTDVPTEDPSAFCSVDGRDDLQNSCGACRNFVKERMAD